MMSFEGINETFSGKTVHVGYNRGHIGLLQFIEGGPLFKDSPQIEVIVFDMFLLICRIWIAVKYPGSLLSVERTEFESRRIAELRSVVSEDDGEQTTKHFESE